MMNSTYPMIVLMNQRSAPGRPKYACPKPGINKLRNAAIRRLLDVKKGRNGAPHDLQKTTPSTFAMPQLLQNIILCPREALSIEWPSVSLCRALSYAAVLMFALRLSNQKNMPREIHKLLAWRVPRYLGEFHFRFRHWPLPWRGLASRRRDGVFAGQFLVGQTLAERRTSGLDKAHAVAGLAFIVTERLLVQITEQHVSKKYLPLYLAEFQFRFNNRENPDIFGDAIRGC